MACSASVIDSSGVAGNLRLASAIRNRDTGLLASQDAIILASFYRK